MFKRLIISLVLMGLAAFALSAGAFAWFSDSGSGTVSITAGTTDIEFQINRDCDATTEGSGDFDTTPAPFTWGGVVPGDVTYDCITVSNTGDGDVDVYFNHRGPFSPNDLLNAIEFNYWTYVGGDPFNNLTNHCGGWLHADDGAFTTGRGCFVGSIPEGGTPLQVRVGTRLPDSGSSQNPLQGGQLGFNVVVTGYTG